MDWSQASHPRPAQPGPPVHSADLRPRSACAPAGPEVSSRPPHFGRLQQGPRLPNFRLQSASTTGALPGLPFHTCGRVQSQGTNSVGNWPFLPVLLLGALGPPRGVTQG